MRFDYENQVCRAQAFTGAATVSAHSIDTLSASHDPTIGRRMCMVAMPTVAQGAGSSMTLEVIQADDAALTSNVEALATRSGIQSAALGDELEVPIPQGVKTKRYLGLRATLTGGTTTITLDAYYMPQDEQPKYKSFNKVNVAEV